MHAAPPWASQSVAEPKRQHAPPAPQYCAHPPGRLPHWIQQTPPGSPCGWRLLKRSKTSTAIAASSLRCRWLCKSVLHESTSCNIGGGGEESISTRPESLTLVLLDAAKTRAKERSHLKLEIPRKRGSHRIPNQDERLHASFLRLNVCLRTQSPLTPVKDQCEGDEANTPTPLDTARAQSSKEITSRNNTSLKVELREYS